METILGVGRSDNRFGVSVMDFMNGKNHSRYHWGERSRRGPEVVRAGRSNGDVSIQELILAALVVP